MFPVGAPWRWSRWLDLCLTLSLQSRHWKNKIKYEIIPFITYHISNKVVNDILSWWPTSKQNYCWSTYTLNFTPWIEVPPQPLTALVHWALFNFLSLVPSFCPHSILLPLSALDSVLLLLGLLASFWTF